MNTLNTDEKSRPFGFWLKAVDRLMAAEFASAFESEGITRREWRLLNVIDGAVPADAKHVRPLPAHKPARLIELGWVTDADGSWTLTDDGRAAKERLGSIVDGIRAKITDAVPADDLATTMATLEQLARAFGWDEETPLPRGRGRRGFNPDGFGQGRGHGFGPRGFGREGHGAPEFDGREHCLHGDHHAAHDTDHGHRGGPRAHEDHGHRGHGHREHGRGRAHFARFAQRSFERGFDAGFTRGRDAQ